MLEEEPRQDSFYEMIDKLVVLNLSVDGNAILKSMAISIQTALEKGLLLEQLILNERNNSMKEPLVKKSKKKKRKHSLYSDESQTEINQQDSSSVIDVNKENIPKFDQAESFKQIVKEYVNKTKPLNGIVKIINDANPKKSVIILKDQASLLSSNSCIIDNKSSNMKQSHRIKFTSEPIVQDYLCGEKNPNLVTIEALHSKTDHSKHPNVIPETALVSSVNSYDKTTAETPQGTLSRSIAEVPSGSCFSKNTSLTPINKEPVNNECQLHVMPCPIKIKSEFCKSTEDDNHPQTDLFTPFNSILSNSQPSQTPNLPESTETPKSTHVDVIDTTKVNENLSYTKKYQSIPSEYQVYIEAVKDLTDEDLLPIFQDLNVVYTRIFNKKDHSFGFISFSSEEDVNEALGLSMKFFIRGKVLVIRKPNKNKNKRGGLNKSIYGNCNLLKRAAQSQDDSSNKKKKKIYNNQHQSCNETSHNHQLNREKICILKNDILEAINLIYPEAII